MPSNLPILVLHTVGSTLSASVPHSLNALLNREYQWSQHLAFDRFMAFPTVVGHNTIHDSLGFALLLGLH